MATVKIIVLSDGETWEALSDCQKILEITDAAYDQLTDEGMSAKHLRKGEIIAVSGVKEE
jgi:hypothetical protein